MPSPFALSQSFAPSAFSPNESARARLTVVWDAKVEVQVNALLELAISHRELALTIVSRRRASDSIALVVHGAKSSCRQLLELAARQNLEVQTATWS